MKVQGRCHCGKITYEAELDPAAVASCHCTDCQMLTGTAYRVSVAWNNAIFSRRRSKSGAAPRCLGQRI
jgi:hypothetical protein